MENWAMSALRGIAVIVFFLEFSQPAGAGLYYSGETQNELPSQWRGFLLDQRMLRGIAVPPAAGAAANPARVVYETAAINLDKASRDRKLTADERADLGALYVRLGESAKAVEILRAAQRDHPNHFHIAANLGTAWQLHGDLERASDALLQGVKLAPGKWQKAEELHLKMVRQRQREPRGTQTLDDLFGVQYVGDSGKFELGRLAAEQRKKLPSEALALSQQLALWLPADARLLWQLAELANAHGDIRTAAAMLDGCVEFGLRASELIDHRRALRNAAEAAGPRTKIGDKATHEEHAAAFKTRSSRPLASKLDQASLPPIDKDGINAIPWSVIGETTVDRRYHPTFAKYLRELNGRTIRLTGFMQPLNEDPEPAAFLFIENPIGCWFCEMPDITGIILVELPAGKSKAYTRTPIRITGKLKLNDSDPENFLYTISEASVSDGG
jgi:tetratricopeptide (TPR) repeat protein